MKTLFKTWLTVSLHPWTPVFLEALNSKRHFITFIGVTIGALTGFGLSWLIYLFTGLSAEDFRGLASV